ncbi:hypothetical protein GY45DRAFT_1373266 [Cubamyces sp. BRFM 1775]|nr:hypothetical protein GY45DRAFT_1373266 [Cubamyces sp. BRFM 1775]
MSTAFCIVWVLPSFSATEAARRADGTLWTLLVSPEQLLNLSCKGHRVTVTPPRRKHPRAPFGALRDGGGSLTGKRSVPLRLKTCRCSVEWPIGLQDPSAGAAGSASAGYDLYAYRTSPVLRTARGMQSTDGWMCHRYPWLFATTARASRAFRQLSWAAALIPCRSHRPWGGIIIWSLGGSMAMN